MYKRADYQDLYAVLKDTYKVDGDRPLPGSTEFGCPRSRAGCPWASSLTHSSWAPWGANSRTR
ncbi:hypothetical protein ACN28S_21970 [Cystobacter fuscus]